MKRNMKLIVALALVATSLAHPNGSIKSRLAQTKKTMLAQV